MKIKLSASFVDAENKPVLDNDEPVVASTLLKRAILADMTPQGTPIPAEEKVKRFELFLKLRSADNDTDWSLEEVALLERAILVFSTLIAGQLHYLLHNKTTVN